jgi:MFS transporter, UMF1 family
MNRKVLAWCLFDFANSSYSAVISAVIFPIYFIAAIVPEGSGTGEMWWGSAISVSMAVVALSSPFLGGLTDFAGLRKRLLLIYTTCCIVSTALLYLLHRGMVLEGFLLIVLANIGLEGGLVFYNAFLSEIAPPQYQGRVSAWGYGIGYLGSIFSLLIALMFVRTGHTTFSWPMVAAFFALFSLPAFLFLPADQPGKSTMARAARQGFIQTIKTFRDIWRSPERRKFLLAYFIYEDGVNTVIVFSSIFAAVTLKATALELIFLYLIVQATALAGAFLMARAIDFKGPKPVVLLSLGLWTLVTIAAYFVTTKGMFMVIAAVAGLGLGTVQAASRAFFTQFIPSGKEAEYFGIYSLVGKSSAILGPLVFGYMSGLTGSQRPAVLSVGVFFLAGMAIITGVRGGGPNALTTSDVEPDV